MKKNKRIIIYILIVLGISLLSFGAAYAWFSATASGTAVTVQSGKLSVSYTNGSTISGNLYPTSSYEKGLSTTVYIGLNTDSLEAIGTFHLDFVNVPSVLKISALKWELRDPTTKALISNGNFLGSSNSITLLSNFDITTTQKGYSLYIWLDGNMVGNEVQNQNFSANLVASAVQSNYVS